jgi:hypothetical protein
VSRSILAGQSNTLASIIKSLFANNEQGFFYDPNDLSTMYQDAVGTIPVTAAGQPVGLMKDKSGRSNHAYQTTSASRPTLQRNATTGAYYLVFDGADDFLLTNNIDFTAADKVSLFAGVRKLSDAVQGSVVELGRGVFLETSGSFVLNAPTARGIASYRSYAQGGSSGALVATTSGTYPAPISNVLTMRVDIANKISKLNVDSRDVSTTTGSTLNGNFGNYPLYIGRRNGQFIPFNGHIYSLIGVGKLVSDTETTAIEKELAKRTGATLNV